MDAEKRLALSNFYREEFLRHIEYLQTAGLVDDTNRHVVDRACELLRTRLDHVCALECFPALAENILQSFDALTRLSALESRERH
jgi:hypothetical protein